MDYDAIVVGADPSVSTVAKFLSENIDIFTPTIRTPTFYCIGVRHRYSKMKAAVVACPYIFMNVFSPTFKSPTSKTTIAL